MVQKACQTADKSPSYTTKVLGGESNANILRKFRDETLAINPQGKEYIKLFYQLLPDAVLLMIKDSHIRTRTASVAIQIVTLIEPELEKKYIPSEIGEILNSLLDDYANTKEASENLRNNILRMKEEMPLMDFISSFNNDSSPSLYSSGGVKHETPHGDKYSREYILVKFKSGALQFRIREICTEVGIIIDKHYKDINVYKIKVPFDKVKEIIDILLEYDEVEYAEIDHAVRIFQTIPADPDFDKLWGLHNTGQDAGTADADMDAPEAWDITTGGSVVVSVIDSGVNYNHEDLASNMWVNGGEIPDNGIDDDGNGYIDDYRGWDFANGDNDPMDDNDHGTHCSGTIGAAGNNGIGVVGVNWTVKIMPLKFIDQCGSGSTSDAIEAILYSKNMGVKISSNSWGGGAYSQALYDAIQEFRNAGGLFVAAAGNEGNNNDITGSYPASYDLSNIIAVAATDRNDNLASFSNYGVTSVDVAAPGVGIYSTVIAGYGWLDGTSMATPQVSGIAALIKAQYPDLGFDGIKNAILNSVDIKPSLDGAILTEGRVNAFNALNQR
ncbi:MAG: S8 family peptidase [Bacteroidota bacterium]